MMMFSSGRISLWMTVMLVFVSLKQATGFVIGPRVLRVAPSSTGMLLPAIKDEANVDDDDLSLEAFQKERKKRLEPPQQEDDDDEEIFDGYAMRDVIVEKWGAAFDVDFQRVEYMGGKEIYLNILPFKLGSRTFRHSTELDYLCHLQAVVEILLKYNQIGNVLIQIDQTNKKPRAGTSPLIAVPLRLDLTPEEIKSILRSK